MMSDLIFYSLASGSSGNCFFIGTLQSGILIDAGLGGRTILKRLKDAGISPSIIQGVFVTHAHGDHIKGVGSLGEKHMIPIYATPETHLAIDQHYIVPLKLTQSKRLIEKEQPTLLGPLSITPFEVDHDANDNVGFFICYQNQKICFATDLGHIGTRAHNYLSRSNHLILEANYDAAMLTFGPYPEDLQKRIRGPRGHMDNTDTAEYLANNWQPDMKNVFLCHLSKENNLPDLAKKTVCQALQKRGICIEEGLKVHVLARTAPSCFTYLL